jgi:hypothetical protein
MCNESKTSFSAASVNSLSKKASNDFLFNTVASIISPSIRGKLPFNVVFVPS